MFDNKGGKKHLEPCLPEEDLREFLSGGVPSVAANVHLQTGEDTCDCVPALIEMNNGVKPEF